MDGTRQALLKRIGDAFPPSEPPLEVVSLLARDLHASAGDIEEALEGQLWSDVSRAVLEEQARNILALSAEGLRHYLPAFIRAAIFEPAGESATYIMYALVPLANFEQYEQGTCALFTPEQAGVIADFLQAMAGEPSFEMLADEVPAAVEIWRRRAG